MQTFLAVTGILVAFAALIYAANLGRRFDEKPVERLTNTIERLQKALHSNDEVTDSMRLEVTKLTDRLEALEKNTNINQPAPQPVQQPSNGDDSGGQSS